MDRVVISPADLDFAIQILEEAKYRVTLARTADTVRALAEAEALARDVRAALGFQNIAEAAKILGATIVEVRQIGKSKR